MALFISGGKLECYKNKRGYTKGVLKCFNGDNQCVGKVFIDVYGLDLKDERTYTLDLEEAWLDVTHVESLTKDYDKLSLKLRKYRVVKVYPEVEGTSYDQRPSEKEEVKDEDLPF